MTTVRFAVLSARRIFNLAGPRHLPEIISGWRGRHEFHDERYEPVRDVMERLYVAGFNRASRHYERLETDVLTNGYRNPIIVSCGRLDRRPPSHLPPHLRGKPDTIACEYLGGSRLWVAQRHGLDVPCVVNDHTNALREGVELRALDELLACFRDNPRTARWTDRGVVVNNLPYMHLPESERYGLRTQSQIRRKILKEVQVAVNAWLKGNDA